MDKYSTILIIIIAAAILVCLFFKDSPSQSVFQQKQVDINRNTQCDIDNLKPSSLDQCFYDKIKDKNIKESVVYLKKKGREAQRIVPQFPNFPDIWLYPPESKATNSSLGEKYCIEFLELLFLGHKFIKTRPKWLRNPKTNRPLELDGYCEELKIALEYQGIQHYEWPNFTNCSKEAFFSQRERDQIKEEVCINKNICLIKIPYTIELKRIPLAIYAKLLDAVPGLNY